MVHIQQIIYVLNVLNLIIFFLNVQFDNFILDIIKFKNCIYQINL